MTAPVPVPAELAGEVLRLITLGLTERVRRDGGTVSPQARALLRALHRADQGVEQAGSAIGTATAVPATVEVSVGDVAADMGASREYVRRLCRAGVLPGRRVGRLWLITIDRERLAHEQDH